MPRRHSACAVALALAFALPTAALAQEPPAAQARQAVELPVTITGTQILIDGVRVNGQGPYRFLFDTGAQAGGRADASLVQALSLPQAGEVQVGDGGGGPTRTLPLYGIEILDVGPVRLEGLNFISRDYNEGGALALRGHIDGVLGPDIFAGWLITIDYAAQKMRLERGALPESNGRDVLDLHPNPAAPTVTMRVGGIETEAHIDTGSMGDVTIGQATADRLTFQSPPVVAGQARTVSGAFDVLEGRISGALELGPVRIDNPTVRIVPHFRTANLGGQFLSRFALTLDMANQRVRLTPSAQPPAPPRRYGLMMRPPQAGQTEIELLGAAPGSPAEAAGLRAGDRITALNGTPLSEVGDRLPAMMRTSPLVVAYVRDGQAHEARLTLD
ncbi:aspartyl protease family protein [Brevundimonas sp. 2R-24]|uniref:Aspartyl protease family protein n=1 Tax=Peiella sedimenti TaxID=3061083 RepID=A0ABT8SK52_9CAUL|nr:aspartyl protease family protein [Caulobacteraceae bacterium XZ-24]